MITALIWPIKESFLSYLEAIEDTVISLAGADQTPDGFLFPASSGSQALEFSGEISITSHGGALQVTLSSPRIEKVQEHVFLLATTPVGLLPLARILDYPSDDTTLRSNGGDLNDIALTLEGAAMLGGVYSPWTRVSPVTILAGSGEQ